MNNTEIAQRARGAFDAYVAATARLFVLQKHARGGFARPRRNRSCRPFIYEQDMRQMSAASELRNLLNQLEAAK